MWRPVADGGIVAGECLVVLCGDGRPCLWPIGNSGWWPPPRRVDMGLASAGWVEDRCRDCGRCRAALVAARPLSDGHEVTVDACVTLGGGAGADFGMEATLDSGVREVRGVRVGGAGAVLWRLDARSGLRRRVAVAAMSMPEVVDSQVAEAWGAHLVALMLRECPDGGRRVRISGDNLAVVRHCAAQGRLRRPCAQAILEPVLAGLATGGWSVAWQAIRRRSNMAADALATEGVFWAARLRAGGVFSRLLRVSWADGSPAS